jgi:hypothetical protein
LAIELDELKKLGESRSSIEIVTNSKGHNTAVKIYEGCTETEADRIMELALAKHTQLQSKLNGGTSA